MATDEEVEERATGGLNGLAAGFYDEGIVNLMQRLDKCLNHNGDYTEKETYFVSSSGIKTYLHE
jgi:hypothetical protein